MDKPTSEKDAIKFIDNTLEPFVMSLKADLQKAHINNAYYIGRCGELEAENERLKEEYQKLGVRFDREIKRFQQRDLDEFEKRKELEAKLDKVKEYCEAYVSGTVGRNEILDLIK
jgi:hypothetical protein